MNPVSHIAQRLLRADVRPPFVKLKTGAARPPCSPLRRSSRICGASAGAGKHDRCIGDALATLVVLKGTIQLSVERENARPATGVRVTNSACSIASLGAASSRTLSTREVRDLTRAGRRLRARRARRRPLDMTAHGRRGDPGQSMFFIESNERLGHRSAQLRPSRRDPRSARGPSLQPAGP